MFYFDLPFLDKFKCMETDKLSLGFPNNIIDKIDCLDN